MDQTLVNLPYAQAYLDAVIICGRDVEQCYERASNVSDEFRKKNIQVKKIKCQFFKRWST